MKGALLIAAGAALARADPGCAQYRGACYPAADQAFAAMERVRGGYSSTEERVLRRAALQASFDIVRAHNAQPGHSYTLGLNDHADLTDAEFKARFTGLRAPARRLRAEEQAAAEAESADNARRLQVSFDWVTAGKVLPVKNQASCGSCWAFSTVGTVEVNAAIAGLPLTSLSEQQLVDCSTANYGCNGGWMTTAFSYIQSAGGLCTSAAYPYTAVQGSCKAANCAKAVRISGYNRPSTQSDANLLTLAQAGAVSVGVAAGNNVFRYYVSGVLDSGSCPTTLDHAIIVVGAGTDSGTGKAYYRVRNSWGASWGESGYVRIVRGKNMCGINSEFSTPIINMASPPPAPSPSATRVPPSPSATRVPPSPTRSPMTASPTRPASKPGKRVTDGNALGEEEVVAVDAGSVAVAAPADASDSSNNAAAIIGGGAAGVALAAVVLAAALIALRRSRRAAAANAATAAAIAAAQAPAAVAI